MDSSIAFLAALADDEFDGRSFNGPSLMKTLGSLSPEVAAYPGTWEGYSAWGVALHCAYFKYFIARSLGAAGAIHPYPFDQGADGFGAPAAVDVPSWAAVQAYLRRAHAAAWAAAAGLDQAALAAIMPEWKIPYSRALAWLASHDSYHVAQIRSMGVPGIKEPR